MAQTREGLEEEFKGRPKCRQEGIEEELTEKGTEMDRNIGGRV